MKMVISNNRPAKDEIAHDGEWVGMLGPDGRVIGVENNGEFTYTTGNSTSSMWENADEE